MTELEERARRWRQQLENAIDPVAEAARRRSRLAPSPLRSRGTPSNRRSASRIETRPQRQRPLRGTDAFRHDRAYKRLAEST
jgi:hypothetical protein